MPTISIGIYVDSAEELEAVASLVKQLLPAKQVESTVENIPDAQVPSAVEETAVATETQSDAKAEPESEKQPAPQVTLETVRAKLAGLMREGKQAQVKEIFATFGVDKLSAIPAEKYGEVLAAAEAI